MVNNSNSKFYCSHGYHYDYEGVANHLAKAQSNTAMLLYQNMIAGFQQHMQIHFLHVRHGNKDMHKQAHKLTQLVL